MLDVTRFHRAKDVREDDVPDINKWTDDRVNGGAGCAAERGSDAL